MVQQVAESLFGSKTRVLVLGEVAKALQPVTAYSIAQVSASDIKNTYEECNKLAKLGIFRAVPLGSKQTGYLYSEDEVAVKLKEFCKLLRRSNEESAIEQIAAKLPMTDYYISLPVSLRITFDVFYSPNYLMVFVDPGTRMSSPDFDLVSGMDRQRVIVKFASLWGREFRYDEVIGASLATNEQAIADGLNYYSEIGDREIIRTLLTRTSDFDLGRILERLSSKGVARLLAVLAVKRELLGEVEEDLLGFLRKRKRSPLDRKFRSDLQNEAIPLLFPNDEAYRGETFARATNTMSQVLTNLAN